MKEITAETFIEAFKNTYNYDATDESYFEDDDFLERIEECISDYEDDDSVSEKRMAKDVYDILHFLQYGDSSDIDDVNGMNKDLHDRFPNGR